jgi:membrane protein
MRSFGPLRIAIQLLRKTIEGFITGNCMRMAAALSYYAVFSLPAVLAIAVTVVGFFYSSHDVRGEVGRQAAHAVGASGARQIQALLADASKPRHGLIESIVGSCIILIAATGVMVELQAAMNDIWEVKQDANRSGMKLFFLKRLFSLIMVMAIAILLLLSLIMNTLLAAFTEPIAAQLPAGISGGLLNWMHTLVTLALIAGLFAAMFKLLPDAPVRWSDVWLGALLTALLFALGNFLVGLYLGHSNLTSVFGAGSSLAVILVWIYYAAMVVLFGAKFTFVWSQRREKAASDATTTAGAADDRPRDTSRPRA